MSVRAICFTSSGSNGGCWVVLVFPRLFFFGKNEFFCPIRDLRQKKKIPSKKKRDLRQKKKVTRLTPKKNKKATYAYFHNRVTLSSLLATKILLARTPQSPRKKISSY